MANKRTSKKTPKIYLWFTSFNSGEHCNTIAESAAAIAQEIVEQMEKNLGKVTNVAGETDGERMLNIFDAINRLEDKFGRETVCFAYVDSSWSCITLIDKTSLNNVKTLLGVE